MAGTVDVCSTRLTPIVALALIDFCDGRGGIAAHDREVIAKCCITVALLESILHQLDQIRTFDRFCWISGQDLGKDFPELLAKTHLRLIDVRQTMDGGLCCWMIEEGKGQSDAVPFSPED